jgi:hypothetical protein
MDCYFFSCHWTEVHGQEILNQGDDYYFSTITEYDVSDIENSTKKVFSLALSAAVTIQNVQPITKEYFEEKSGKPFFL